MTGKVILVGAGPGNQDLLTLRGKEAIEQADVVVYDRLVGAEILQMIPTRAEQIDVGKEAGHHKVPQEIINQILLSKALQGNVVVRLKGGDPFVFGRGGEELVLLRQYSIPFEVVPGITSAVAAASYGGIPVTHRDLCSSVHIITAHPKAGKPMDIDFEALVRTKGTLVFLMGVTALPQIVEGLLSAGMVPSMPAAMVEQGTTPQQRRIDGTIKTLPQRAIDAQVKSPAIIVVGKVCALAEDFCWVDQLPLKGKTILVTRPQERIGTLSKKLRVLGAAVVEYPCIQTLPVTPCPAMEQALGQLHKYQWLCFTSPAGVDCFWKQLRAMGKDARVLGKAQLAVIGQGTAKALRRYGLEADLMPTVYDTPHLGAALGEVATGKVLILRADLGSPELTQALDIQEVTYDDIAVYNTVYENPQSQTLRQQVESGEIPYVTFTSGSTVEGFVCSVGLDADLRKVTGLCIGKQTAQKAQAYGMNVKIAEKATIDALVDLACQEIGETP